MSVQRLFHTKWLTEFGLFLCRHLPRRAGYALATLVAWVIALFKPALYRVVVSNLRHVLGEEMDRNTLDRTARRLFKHAGQTYYDFYNALTRPQADIQEAVHLPEGFQDLLRAEEAQGQGVLILALHTSNFDLAALTLGTMGFHCQALSLSNPPGGFGILNRVRETAGHEMTPISPASLRKALRRLKSGGIVVSGSDHPVYEDGPTIPFFGEPAYLPLGSARLALMSQATVVMVACAWNAERGYWLRYLGPIHITRSGNREADVWSNTASLARIMEGFIRDCPEQWLLFYPVWEDGLRIANKRQAARLTARTKRRALMERPIEGE